MDPLLFERAKDRARSLGFATFSAYVCQLIRTDIARGGGITVAEEIGADPLPALPPRQEVSYIPKKSAVRVGADIARSRATVPSAAPSLPASTIEIETP